MSFISNIVQFYIPHYNYINNNLNYSFTQYYIYVIFNTIKINIYFAKYIKHYMLSIIYIINSHNIYYKFT